MIDEGWYIPKESDRLIYPRWVLGQIGDMVRYSKGGTEHFVCKESTFKKWMKQAERASATETGEHNG
jgi:hypothetical protein